MLYTFSQADYPPHELEAYFSQADTQDALLLWQDAVLLAVKYPALFAQCKAECYALDLDINARGLTALIAPKVRSISLPFLVQLTERYSPQFAL